MMVEECVGLFASCVRVSALPCLLVIEIWRMRIPPVSRVTIEFQTEVEKDREKVQQEVSRTADYGYRG